MASINIHSRGQPIVATFRESEGYKWLNIRTDDGDMVTIHVTDPEELLPIAETIMAAQPPEVTTTWDRSIAEHEAEYNAQVRQSGVYPDGHIGPMLQPGDKAEVTS